MQGQRQNVNFSLYCAVQLFGDEAAHDRRGIEGFGKNLGLIPHPVFLGLGILGSSLGDVSAQIFKGDAGGASVAFDVNMPPVFNMLTAWEVKLGVGASPLAVYIQDLFLGSCPQN